MNKAMYTCLLFVICVTTLLFAKCGNKTDRSTSTNMFYNEFVMDDTKTLDSSITQEYDLNELKSFFEGSKMNENIGFGMTMPALMFNKVNHKYPVEVLRTSGYSVYRVKQGGYFYVFWAKPFAPDTNQTNIEPSVYFTAYLSSNISLELFDSLIPGISTATDVLSIDPSMELSFLSSNGIFSYSYLNDETVLQIEYMYQESINGHDDLVVKEKMIVARDLVPTRYSALLSSDLP